MDPVKQHKEIDFGVSAFNQTKPIIDELKAVFDSYSNFLDIRGVIDHSGRYRISNRTQTQDETLDSIKNLEKVFQSHFQRLGHCVEILNHSDSPQVDRLKNNLRNEIELLVKSEQVWKEKINRFNEQLFSNATSEGTNLTEKICSIVDVNLKHISSEVLKSKSKPTRQSIRIKAPSITDMLNLMATECVKSEMDLKTSASRSIRDNISSTAELAKAYLRVTEDHQAGRDLDPEDLEKSAQFLDHFASFAESRLKELERKQKLVPLPTSPTQKSAPKNKSIDSKQEKPKPPSKEGRKKLPPKVASREGRRELTPTNKIYPLPTQTTPIPLK